MNRQRQKTKRKIDGKTKRQKRAQKTTKLQQQEFKAKGLKDQKTNRLFQ